MRRQHTLTILLLSAATTALSAQPPATPILPPAIRSPEVAADRRVTFRIAARSATAVSVGIEGSPSRPMQKDDTGVWSLTTEPLEPDFYGSEIIPQVERSYKTAADRGSRAIAGLSMGGGEALVVGLNHLDRFAVVGAFSSAVREPFESRFPRLTSSASDHLRTLWIACGTSDGLFEGNRKLQDWLTTKQVRVTAIDTPGAHTWMVWRRNLAAFAPLLFK